MADIAFVAARVAPTNPANCEIYDFVAGEALTVGQVVGVDATTGKATLADADTAGKPLARGIVTSVHYSGVSVLKRGHVAGFTIPQAYDAAVFLSNTPGAVGDGAGTVSVAVGRVSVIPDGSLTKCLYFDFAWV